MLDVDLDGDEVENTADDDDDDDTDDDDNCGVLLRSIIFDTDCVYRLLCE